MDEMALSYLGRRTIIAFISDVVKVKKNHVSLAVP